jgi:hypothetical protein
MLATPQMARELNMHTPNLSSGWQRHLRIAGLAASFACCGAGADVITQWNVTSGGVITAAKLGTPPANRVMAIAQTAAYVATNAITHRYPDVGDRLEAPAGASVEAAVAAVHRLVLQQLVPSQQLAIESAYQEAIGPLGASEATRAGIAVGERAAAETLAAHARDGATAPESYRPQTAAGVYVPTVLPAVPHWPGRIPWLMSRADQFRPGPPPLLTSERWALDYNEVKVIGGQHSASRSPAQTEMARFWEATLPPVYHGLVRSVATMPGRDVTRNARLFAAVTQASDDALVAVFDAKYHYGFWRPITAIRNGDIDGNDATTRDPSWRPLIDTPLHPEYPCAHCIVSAAIGQVLLADLGDGPVPVLTSTSSTADGAARQWPSIEAFVREVADARVYGGVHYRYSAEVGAAMGRQIGDLAAVRHVRAGVSQTANNGDRP